MRLKFLKHNREQRLLLFFDGWASHPAAHRDLIFDGYDTLVAYGYDNLDFDMSRLDGYIEIAVVGWSYGVAVATRFLESNRDLPVTLRLAVNGTVYTVNDSYGIPEKIFNATLWGSTAVVWQNSTAGCAVRAKLPTDSGHHSPMKASRH